MDDQQIGLLRDRVGDGACAGVGAPVRIANLEAVAEVLGLPAHDRRPAFRQIEAHASGTKMTFLPLRLRSRASRFA